MKPALIHHRCIHGPIHVHKVIPPLGKQKWVAEDNLQYAIWSNLVERPIAVIQPGDVFSVVEEINRRWNKVIFKDVIGYTFGNLLNKTAELEDM